MSFSGDVKRELADHIGPARHCQLAELAALLSHLGTWSLDPPRLTIRPENGNTCKKVFTLLEKTFNIKEMSSQENETVTITNPAKVITILNSIGLIRRTDTGWVSRKVPAEAITEKSCCGRAYIRGAFLSSGSMTDPEKNYHMEFVLDIPEQAERIQQILQRFDVASHIITRERGSRQVWVLYLKDGSQIVDVLNIMEAFVSLMDLENVRIVKDMRNQINRKVNCEAANLDRVVSASVKQIQDIRFIQRTTGLDELPRGLKEMAALRLEHEDASLKELGELLDPPVGKSGVNHRLRRLSEIAEGLRNKGFTASNQSEEEKSK